MRLLQSNYPRESLQLGIVHVGFGAFHRAHQAVYIDAYMQASGDLRWGIAGVNLRAEQSAMLKQMQLRDGEYVLKTIDYQGITEYRLLRPHVQFADWTTHATEAEGLVAYPSVRLLTITVTESGYSMDDTGKLNAAAPEIANELAGGKPTTIYAYLRAGLRARMHAESGAITIMCCDNLRANGDLLRRNFIRYLELCNDFSLLEWVRIRVSFPCSMVDRITPRAPASLSVEVAEKFGIQNDCSVLGESYLQWVVENSFWADFPALDTVGVLFTKDVHGYEDVKIRVLNGGHTALVYFAALQGLPTYDLVFENPKLSAFFDAFENNEVLPALGEFTPVHLQQYLATIRTRFVNKHIADTVGRIAADGYSKQGIFLLPTLLGCYQKNIIPTYTLQAIASWYVFMRHVVAGRIPFVYVDAKQGLVRPFLSIGQEVAFAQNKELWGDVPTKYPQFVGQLCGAIEQVWGDFSF